MRYLRSAFTITAICFSVIFAQAKPENGAMKTVPSGKFTFSYQIEGVNLVAKVSCQSTGWVSVGFNPKKVMKKAFVVMGAVVDGKPVVSEEFGTGMFSHAPVTGLGGKNVCIVSDCVSENGIVTLSFTMPLSIKDGMHADLAAGKKAKLILATGGSGDLTRKHKSKSAITITL